MPRKREKFLRIKQTWINEEEREQKNTTNLNIIIIRKVEIKLSGI